MKNLFAKHFKKVENVSLSFINNIYNEIYWEDRLIGIKGQRGVGKTTLMLQYIKKELPADTTNLYVSLDDIYFANNTIVYFASDFIKTGGKYLFLDEVHKYPNWSQELKNLYDDYPELKIVFTGSSLLEILNARADLSRRAMVYNMSGLSFREYLNFSLGTSFNAIPLDDILNNHTSLEIEINKEIKPIQHFQKYIKSGFYPFFKINQHNYLQRIEEVINMTLEIELLTQYALNIGGIRKLKQLLFIISKSVPFKPNVTKLSERIGVSRNTLISYLNYLNDAKITQNIYANSIGITILQKPEKIYLQNTNFIYALCNDSPNIGNIRETFFVNQLLTKHKLNYSKIGDFIVDEKYIFEIGGKNKTLKQIKGVEKSFIAADNIEFGYNNTIPLWLFGFLY